MKAIVLNRPEDWEVREVADPAPAADEVVINVVACGLCGTDLHTLAGDNPMARYPVTPGHEFVGVVSAVGQKAHGIHVGDRVAVDPSRSCGRCRLCLGGHANLCEDKGGYGSRYQGGLAERIAVRGEACVRLSDQISWRAGLLAEPLSCVLNGVRRVGEVLGRSLLVLGGGTIGLTAGACFAAAGADVLVSEPIASRRAMAVTLGLRAVAPDQLDPLARWDVVVDASGVPEVITAGIDLVGRGGTFLLMGVAPGAARISISPQRLNMWEIRIIGSSSVNMTFGAAVEMLELRGDVFAPLVTDLYGLGDFADALTAVRRRDAIKVAVNTGIVDLD
jgi:2-desacetyl-2-hydroxyethyl bacteriochlorophyllide A dehydrogenase